MIINPFTGHILAYNAWTDEARRKATETRQRKAAMKRALIKASAGKTPQQAGTYRSAGVDARGNRRMRRAEQAESIMLGLADQAAHLEKTRGSVPPEVLQKHRKSHKLWNKTRRRVAKSVEEHRNKHTIRDKT